jgi:transglutaminase-like putative cysteine protease
VAIHVALSHITSYRYDRLVALGPQLIRLRPAPHCRTPILSYSLKITPSQHFMNWQQDPFANYLARVVVPDRTRDFTVTVALVAEMAVYNPFDFFLEPSAEDFPFRYEPELARELAPYLVKDEVAGASPRFKSYLRSIDTKRCQTTNFVVRLNQQLQGDVSYLIRMEPGVQTPEQTLTLAAGSCRDSAWLLVQLLRHLGLAARFVSGYLLQLKADVKSLDGPSGASADFTDLHAWCEVYLPGAGWIGLDPTSGLLAGEGHIPLAATPEPGAAAPVSGAVDQAEVEFHHHMEITRIYESPRVTFPYSEETWQSINVVGESVDRQLEAMDVRLTMGGEPTFVSVDDRDGAEWNTTALGPTKRALSSELLLRLAEHYGKGGFLHFGQGKWYPGEQLPRWALSVYWRADGTPIWKDAKLLSDERSEASYTSEDAQRFAKRLAEALGVTAHHHLPAYEDTYYYLWRERRLPVNVDPLDPRLDDAQERERIRRVFDQGLSKVVGYVLPLARNTRGSGFHSGPWFLRDESLLLLPGDSPMGYRLPLDALPWVAEEDREIIIAEDPFVPASSAVREVMATPMQRQSNAQSLGFGPAGRAYVGGALPQDAAKAADSKAAVEKEESPKTPPTRLESAARYVRTALCVEPRGGG